MTQAQSNTPSVAPNTADKKYNAITDEKQFLSYWKEHKTYKFNPSTQKKIYSIDTPPPTMSGKMHIGHACSFSQQDFIARYKRMRGFEVFYPFGTDDNGLPTEKLVQKEKNVLSAKMEREAFVKVVMDYIAQERPRFIQDWINLGMSVDFDIQYSTIDPHCQKVSQKSFLDLAKKGLVYQKEAPVIWDTVFQTAIAQAELVDVEKKSFFNDIVFTLADGATFNGSDKLIIATTRPELLGACVAIFAHPDDKKYQHLFGKHALSPLYNVKVPILADEKVNPEKGTGIVMCCTFGDQTDIEWYKKHKLPLKVVIGKDGKMTAESGKYDRLKVEDARKEIIKDLKEAGLLLNQKEITHVVNVGERSGVPVEIIQTKQWYVSYLDKKEQFLEYANKLQWHPPHMKVRLDNWIRGLNWDWAVARQRKYGVPIPVWHGSDGKIYFADESQLPVDPTIHKPLNLPAGVTVTPELDVFDTWFTSASTPIIAKELMKGTPIYDKLLPMDLRPQAHDIINFWLFYTLAKTNILYGQNPWKSVAISGYVTDPHGEKMSKSKGNTISPQEIAKKFPADAMRFWAATSKLGEDMPYQEKELVAGSRLINKMWNAAKFVAMYCESFDKVNPQNKRPAKLHPNDEWLLAELNIAITEATSAFDDYEYGKAKTIIDTFFWNIFCDQYLESIKKIHYAPEQFEAGTLESAQWTLKNSFLAVTKMLAPILPFVTEAIYTNFYVTPKEVSAGASIHTQAWPSEFVVADKHARENGKVWQDFIVAIRRNKAENNLALNTPIDPLVIDGPANKIALLKVAKTIIAGTLLANIVFEKPTGQTITVGTDIVVSATYKPVDKKKE